MRKTPAIDTGIPDRSFLFWQRWLLYSSLLFAFFGLVLAVFADSSLFLFYHRKLARLFWGANMIPDTVMPFFRFTAGPEGGTIACCYILLAFIAYYPFKRKERWSRNAIAVGFGAWFIIDSTVSVICGAYFQLYIFNGISLLQKLLPLFFTWKAFDNNIQRIHISQGHDECGR